MGIPDPNFVTPEMSVVAERCTGCATLSLQASSFKLHPPPRVNR